MDAEIVTGLATAGALVTGPVVAWFTARLATRATRETAEVATEPSHREQDRLTFEAIVATVRAEGEQQVAELRTDVQHVRAEVAEERAGRAEDRRLCEERDRKSQRKIDALLRFMWSMARVMEVNQVPVPVLPPRDKVTLEEYDLPA